VTLETPFQSEGC